MFNACEPANQRQKIIYTRLVCWVIPNSNVPTHPTLCVSCIFMSVVEMIIVSTLMKVVTRNQLNVVKLLCTYSLDIV